MTPQNENKDGPVREVNVLVVGFLVGLLVMLPLSMSDVGAIVSKRFTLSISDLIVGLVALGALSVSIWQARLFRTQLAMMTESGKEATEQLKLATAQGKRHETQLRLAAIEADNTSKSLELTTQQLQLAREQFQAGKRPRLFVRAVSISPTFILENKPGGIAVQHTGTYTVSYHIVNVGEDVAHVERVMTMKTIVDEPMPFNAIRAKFSKGRDFVDDVPENNTKLPFNLAPGESVEFEAKSDHFTTSTFNGLNPQRSQYLVGFVEYRGGSTFVRRTGFVRKLKRGVDWSLARVDDMEDYEYAD